MLRCSCSAETRTRTRKDGPTIISAIAIVSIWLGRQNDLVKAILETGKPTIVLLINSGPLSINYIAENVPAILEGFYFGQETGVGVADVLFGDYNPAGKLTISFPRSVGQLPLYYNRKPTARRGYLFANKEPLFPFGFGLSYTTFAYSNLKVSPAKIGLGGQCEGQRYCHEHRQTRWRRDRATLHSRPGEFGYATHNGTQRLQAHLARARRKQNS